jgi:hypothetical protein
LQELFGDVLSALMIAAVLQTPAGFLKHYVHICTCPFVNLQHFDNR